MATKEYIAAVKSLYVNAPTEYANVLTAIASQWALESGWGKSKLAMSHNNFGGMKYRKELSHLCDPVVYTDWEGQEALYCALADPEDYYEVYFAFIGRQRYKGVEEHLGSPRAFLEHLYNCGYVGSMPGGKEKYVDTILDIMSRLPQLIKDPKILRRQRNINILDDYPLWLMPEEIKC